MAHHSSTLGRTSDTLCDISNAHCAPLLIFRYLEDFLNEKTMFLMIFCQILALMTRPAVRHFFLESALLFLPIFQTSPPPINSDFFPSKYFNECHCDRNFYHNFWKMDRSTIYSLTFCKRSIHNMLRNCKITKIAIFSQFIGHFLKARPKFPQSPKKLVLKKLCAINYKISRSADDTLCFTS